MSFTDLPTSRASSRGQPLSTFIPVKRRLKVSTALVTVLGFGLGASAALAQEVTISDDRDTPFSTSTIDGGTAADVIIDSGVSVSVDDGAAATLDSSNSITNNGTIDSNATSGAVGVHIDTGAAGNTLTGGLVQNGSINAGELDDDDNPGSGNVGILIDGDGTFVGDIVSDDVAPISVVGTDSYGLALRSSMVGDITLDNISVSREGSKGVSITGTLDGDLDTTGTISASGSQGAAIAIDGRVTGGIVNTGRLESGTPRTFGNDGEINDAIPGIATVQIGGRAEGGFLNNQYFVDSEGNISETDDGDSTAVTGSISANAGAPAIRVSPTGGADAFVGAYGGTGYAIVNEGTVSTSGQNLGTDASAILIEGATIGGTARGAILEGGILNRSSGDITATTVDGEARAIEVGAGGVVPSINNAGDLAATTNVSTDENNEDGPGGDAYGILIQSGGSVNSITNSGNIVPTARGAESSAYGIVDRSGTLTSIVNSGDITPLITTESSGGTTAIDVSAAGGAVNISNSGTIAGNILFGSGGDTLSISGGTVAGRVAFGAGGNSMSLSGDGIFNGLLSSEGGTLALNLGGSSQLRFSNPETLELSSLNVSNSAKLYIPATIGQTSIVVNGNATVSGSNSLVPVFTNIIENEGTVTLISADSLTVADPDNVISISQLPYFYTIEGQFVDATSVGLLLKRKSAEDLGLSDSEATLYEHSIGALNSDVELATAVGNITTEEGFTAAYRQMQPASFGTSVATAAVRHQDLAFGMISNRMDSMRDTLRLADTRLSRRGFWAQESVTFYNKTETDNDPGFDGNTAAFALGFDKEMLGLDTLGLAFSQAWSSLEKDMLPGEPLKASQSQVDLYGSWSSGGFFIHGLAAAAYNSYKSERMLEIGDFERTSTAKWHGQQFSGNLRAGYEIPLGAFILTPSNSINYMKLHQNSYEETGGGGMNLTIDAADFTSLRNAARLALAYYSELVDEAYFKFQLQGGWIRSLDSSGLDTTGSFAAAPDDSFTLVTDPLAKNTVAGGLSLAYVSGTSTLSASYDYERSDKLDSHAASIIWYMRF